MTNRSTLIADLERATAGNCELDARIHAFLLGPDWTAEFEDKRVGEWLVFCSTRFFDKGKQHRECKKPPYYTTSIDAAMTLVPEGMGCQVSMHTKLRKAAAFVFTNASDFESAPPAAAPTPALALVIASLKARGGGE